jgi:hypothetical protein
MKLIPPYYWDSDNDWRVPSLDITMCPVNIPLPLTPWGSQSQSRLMQSTWHFYIEDFKFEALWQHPEKLLTSKPLCVIEPNFSIPWDAPGAIALFQIYRKRHCARYWQSQGIFTLVDLNVDYAHETLNLLGIPKGWSAYATRGACWDEEILKHQYAIAQNHSGKEKPLFVVYAGGKKIESVCRHNGWLYFDTYRGPMTYRGAVHGQG